MAGVWYFRIGGLVLLLLVPLLAAMLSAPQGGNRFVATWMALPMREGGPGLLLAYACLWAWGAWQRRRQGDEAAVQAMHGLIWFVPIIAALGYLVWFFVQQLIGWKPAGSSGLMEIGKPVFVFALVASLVLVGGFWAGRLMRLWPAPAPETRE